MPASAKEIRPLTNYTHGLEFGNGARIFWHHTRMEMGRHIIFSGSCCDIIGENLKECLLYAMSKSFKITRLDLAFDIRNTNLSIQHGINLVLKGEVKTHARKAPIIRDGMGSGLTLQIGVKGSAQFVRIYDKAAEMGVDGSWVRVETSYGKRKAQKATQTYLQGSCVREMVRGFVAFPLWRKWNKLLGDRAVTVKYEKSITNTRKWLYESVAKTIAREMLFDDGEEFYEKMLQRIKWEYKTLTIIEQVLDF
jgi:DNA relaxase NicK